MTMVSEVNAPVVDPADRRVPVGRGHYATASAVIAVSSAIIVASVNVFALTYLSSAITDLREIDKRLELLQAFEERIAGRMDVMNIGVQNRLETLSGEVHGQFNNIDAKLGRLESNSDAMPENEVQIDVSYPAPPVGDSDSFSDEIEPGEQSVEEPKTDSHLPAARPKKQTAKQRPSPNLAYERVQSADGKVYYRKVD